jgi:steroid delta-isomerase-like uncharacterized protein
MDTSETLKAAIRRAFAEEAFNKGNLAALNEIFAQDMVDRSVAKAEDQMGLEGFKRRIAGHRAGFPDLRITVEDEDMVVEGDKVTFRWTMEGTNQGSWLGRPATGRQMKISGMNLERLEGGKIVEHFSYPDMLRALQQLGFLPTPEQAATGAIPASQPTQPAE